METIKQFTEQKIKEFVDILNIQMTKENVNEITYGDKLAALGGLNMAISIMKLIDPTFRLERLISAIDGAVKGENVMTAFDNSEFEKYKAETQEKWGSTDAYKEHTDNF